MSRIWERAGNSKHDDEYVPKQLSDLSRVKRKGLSTCKHGEASLADKHIDHIAEEVQSAAVALHCLMELIHALSLHDSLANESKADKTEQNTADKVGEDARSSRVHDRLEPVFLHCVKGKKSKFFEIR
jgi:hypothetical protein